MTQKRRAELVIDKPADEVWARVRDFGDISWIPNAEKATFDGTTRRVSREAWDFELQQRLTNFDEENHTLSYELAEPLDFSVFFGPDHMVNTITGTLAIAPQGDSSSYVTWDIETEDYMIEGTHAEYQASLENLKALLEG
jgi:hypothetical protein